MTNPLIAAFAVSNDLSKKIKAGFEDSPEREAEFKKVSDQFEAAMRTADKRLALATMLTANTYNNSYNASLGRHELDFVETAAMFTDDAFEAQLIGIALNGWWNDILDAACLTLEIDPEGDWNEQLAAKYPEKCGHMLTAIKDQN